MIQGGWFFQKYISNFLERIDFFFCIVRATWLDPRTSPPQICLAARPV
jgi:hypothetical protein